VSPSVDGGPEDGPVARGTSGGAARGRQLFRRLITQCFGRGAARVRLDPGNGNVMMGTDLLKTTTDVLNENLIAARLDGELSMKGRTQYSLSVIKLRRRRTGLEEIPSETRIHLRA